MDPKRAIRSFFDREAVNWEAEHGPGSPRDQGFRENLETLARILAAKTGRRAVLDIGCATGLYLFALDGLFEKAVGVDISEAMLATARRRQAARDGAGALDFVLAESETLSVESLARSGAHPGPFDLIVFIGSLEHMPDKRRVLAAARALMKPDGHLVVIMPHRHALEFLIERAARLGRQPKLLATDRHLTPGEMRRLAARVGLQVESAAPIVMPIAHKPMVGRRRQPLTDRLRKRIPALRLLGTVAYTLRKARIACVTTVSHEAAAWISALSSPLQALQ